jgi:arginyl-tRNA synthetase
MNFKTIVARILTKHLDLSEKEIADLLEKPKNESFGDVAFPCFSLAKMQKKTPADIARELANRIDADVSLHGELEKVEAAGAYVNFFLNPSYLAHKLIREILSKGERYGAHTYGKGLRVMVEYSAPNTNKPLHVGHLRNDSIGMAISNILEFTGHEIIRANLVNDRGIHICQSMLAYMREGNNLTPEDEGLKGDAFVGKYYVLFHERAKKQPEWEGAARELLRKWEEGDPETRALWKKMRDWALEGFKQTYSRFGSRFDVFFFESEFYDKAGPLLELGVKKGVFKHNDKGALVALLEKHGLPNKVVLREDGTSIYITNDIALTKHKFEAYNLDWHIFVVASEQNLYFKQLFKIFELLGMPWASKCEHLSYGLVLLPEGRMKSREGKVIDADELMDATEAAALEEVKKRHTELNEEEARKRAHAIALAAIKFSMLKVSHEKDLLFEIKRAIEFEGETGPYVQYAYARAMSILEKADTTSENVLKKLKNMHLDTKTFQKHKQLLRMLAEFEEKVEHAARTREVHVLCQYLIELAKEFNSFYHSTHIISMKEEERTAMLGLVCAVAQTLKNGLTLLNIPVLQKM